jgi:ketosteroid isomerase-like protein
MRTVIYAALVCLALGAPAGAQTTNAELTAPIQKFMESFNKGDTAAAAATHVSGGELVIIDEIPPYVWQGTKAFQTWSADLDGDAKKNGITDPHVTVSRPTRIERTGDQAYVVVPAVYTFTQHGAAMRETSQMTFVLKKSAGAGGWLISGWTWTGPKAKAAGAPAKK